MRCWHSQWRISNALDRGELAAQLARGHASRCDRCRDYGRRLAALHGALERGAGSAEAPRPAPAQPRRAWPWLRWPVVAGLAAAAVAIALFGVSPALRDGPRGSGATASGARATEPGGAQPASRALAAVAATAMRPAAAREAAGRVARALDSASLERELRALLDDSQRGVRTVLTRSGLRGRL
jgi:hypothetical protein